MDIREIDGLWCDDITFCPERCGWKDCPRNQANIRDRAIPHSFSLAIPQDCPKQQERVGEAEMKEYIVQAIAQETIDSFDAHDAPELIRCKDCKWWGTERLCENSDSPCFQNGCTHGNWYCADGERHDAE